MTVRDEHLLRAADAEARRRACELFDRPLVLEAGAGTGKTAVLVARTLSWLLGPGWEAATLPDGGTPAGRRIAARALDGLVAITFTEAAAAEMAERIATALSEVAEGRPPLGFAPEPLSADWPERAGHLLSALDRLGVQTIHGFCRTLLASFPLEAGVHPRFAIDADGEATAEIVRDVLDERLRAAYRVGDPALLRLAAAGIGPGEIAEAIEAFRAGGGRADDLATDPLAPARLAGLLRRVEEHVGGLAREVTPRLSGRSRVDKPRQMVTDLAALVELIPAAQRDSADLEKMRQAAARFREQHGDRLGQWRREDWNKAESAAFAGVTGTIAESSRRTASILGHLEALDCGILSAGREVLAALLGEIEARRRALGLVSFDDLLRLAVDLLRRNEGVRRQVRRGLQQLLVDEFQDTDPLQCQLLELLALDGPVAERPGLFLVGDPKQSIYGWRRADLAAYARFVDRVLTAEPPGERATLSVNFRSVPAVLAEVERAVAPCFHAEPGVQPPFAPLLACENRVASACPLPAGRAAVEHWVSWAAEGEPPAARRTRVREADRLEALAIARDLDALRSEAATAGGGGWRWSDVALIFRVSTAQEPYLEALRDRGIPFRVEGDRAFYQRREILDATSLVRAVLDPGDSLALVATLRSPWVGVPDAALLPLWSEQLPRLVADLSAPDAGAIAALRAAVARAAEKVPEVPGLDRIADWPLLLIAACEGIAILRHTFLSEPADRFVAELRRRFPVEALSAARWLGRFRLANLERWMDRLLAALVASRGDVDGVLRRLRRAVAEGEEDAAAGAPAGGPDAVRILTIHKAKGLDFDHVYLPQLHHGSAGSRADRPPFQGGDEPEYALFGAPTPGLDAVLEGRARVADAERVRLLYVATTRAKRRTVLLGAGSPHGPDDRQGSLLALFDAERLRRLPDLAAGAPVDDADGVRWRLLGLEGVAQETPSSAEALPPVAYDPWEAARRFARRRQSAAETAARPWVGGITASLAAPSDEPATPPDRFGGHEVGMAVGSAVHRFLELLEPLADADRERTRLAPLLDRELVRRLPGRALAEARSLLAATLHGLIGGRSLLRRLREIAPRVLARELPLLLTTAGGPSGSPSAATVGTLDLLYRDPLDGRTVVADFKTDRVSGDAEIEERAAHHGRQLRAYGRAVERAVALAEPPRLEVWMLAADRIVVVPWKEGRS